MELEEDYKRECGSGTSMMTGYSVESRHDYRDPIQISGQIFDNRWRRVQFKQGSGGVPVCARHEKLDEHGYFGYAAAQALRWWFHAQAEYEHGLAVCLETRIISHKITLQHEIEAVAAHDHVHGDDRSNIMPDWGKAGEDDVNT